MKEKPRQTTMMTGDKAPTRLIALTDGLFATVLTLLVLDLRIPDALTNSNVDAHTFLRTVGPHLFSYALTFLVAGAYWFAHHRDFDFIVRTDRRLLSYNLSFLVFIGLLPFTTAGVSLGAPGKGVLPFYWTIYASNLILAGAMLTITWTYAFTHQLVDPRVSPADSRRIIVRQLVIPAVFAVSIATESLFSQYVLGPFTLLIIPLVLAWADRSASASQAQSPSRAPWRDLFWRAASILPWAIVIGLAAWPLSW
jgi:uncharacterized membrane protein